MTLLFIINPNTKIPYMPKARKAGNHRVKTEHVRPSMARVHRRKLKGMF